VQTWPRLGAIVRSMQNEPTDPPRRDSLARHPIRASVEEVEHLRDVGEEGKSPATPAIVAATVLAVAVPLAAILIFVAFTVMHFA
jgi:hypothetical protein